MTSTVVTSAGVSTVITELDTGQTVLTQVDGPSTVISDAAQPGMTGPAGAGIVLSFPFTSAATWTISHGLGRYPFVQLVDTLGAVFDGDVEFPDLNTAVITHAAPKSGFALVS